MSSAERPVESANRAIVALNVCLEDHTNPMYFLPPDPTPRHLARVVADLDALVAVVPEAAVSDTLRERYQNARAAIQHVATVAQAQRTASGVRFT